MVDLNADVIEQFRADGATVVRGAIGDDWLERLAAAIERDIASPGPFDHSYQVDGGRFHGNLRIWQNDPDFEAFCLDGPATHIARAMLGATRLNLLYDQLFVKEPGADHPTRWHNDQPYWPVSGRDVVSVWVALDQVTEETGRVEFIRGSHLWDRWFQPETFGPNKSGSGYEQNLAYEPMPDIDATRSDHDIITWDLEPGDVYVFNGMTVHGAGGNTTVDRRRRGYTVRYCGDDVRYDPRIGVSQPILAQELSSGDLLDCEQFPLISG
ncbi:MAG: phytanoyl-CoA dioxygenase family protein [Acidimicrobiales bacterium]